MADGCTIKSRHKRNGTKRKEYKRRDTITANRTRNEEDPAKKQGSGRRRDSRRGTDEHSTLEKIIIKTKIEYVQLREIYSGFGDV